MGKRGGKKLLASHRRKWEYNVKIDLQEVELGAWTALVWLRIGVVGPDLVNDGKEILDSLKCMEFLD